MRREVTRTESRLILWATEIDEAGNVAHDAQLHLARQLFDGRLIFACDLGQALYDTGPGYYLFPFLGWLARNARCCPTCKVAMYTNGLLSQNNEPLPVWYEEWKQAAYRKRGSR